jgi:hypothetical protein
MLNNSFLEYEFQRCEECNERERERYGKTNNTIAVLVDVQKNEYTNKY